MLWVIEVGIVMAIGVLGPLADGGCLPRRLAGRRTTGDDRR